jgi:hypothetical protein
VYGVLRGGRLGGVWVRGDLYSWFGGGDLLELVEDGNCSDVD